MNMGGKAPHGIKGKRPAGKDFKAPTKGGDKARNATNGASGLPKAQSASDKNRYRGVPQPQAYSNVSGPKLTKFVC